MEVHSRNIGKVFSSGGDIRYILPHFQRPYAWSKENWETLLNDIYSIYEIYDYQDIPEHFMGALVVINDGMSGGTIPTLKLVDGQQRLTTISLLLCALGAHIKARQPDLYRKIRKHLVNTDEQGDFFYKLLPTSKYTDRDTYQYIIQYESLPQNSESQIGNAYEYFSQQLRNRLRSIDSERFFLTVINALHLVLITLNNNERPYEIFESLNAKGKALSQADLVRNYIAMRLPPHYQIDIFEEHWAPIETLLREDRTVARLGEISAFLRHYLAYQTRNLYNKEHIYARFRDRMETMLSDKALFLDELARLHRFAEYYDCLLRPQNEPDPMIREALRKLNILEATTAYPFLLAAYEDYKQNQIDRTTFLDALQIIENYLMRRYIAGMTSNYTNKMFPTLYRDIDKTNYSQSLSSALATKDYPSDAQVREAIINDSSYDRGKPQKTLLILESINRFLSLNTDGYTVLNAVPTIEHIMPQTLNEDWCLMLGDDHAHIHQEYLHRLGNLTLVTQEWNSTLSNRTFDVKYEAFRRHALRLNNGYFNEHNNVWNKEAMNRRAEYLADFVVKIWPALGQAISTKEYKGQQPVGLIFKNEEITVSTWRELGEKIVELAIRLSPDFDRVAERLWVCSREQRPRSKQLSNGWWFYYSLSANSVALLCEQVADALDLSPEDWEIITRA